MFQILALRRMRQEDLYKFKVNLAYRVRLHLQNRRSTLMPPVVHHGTYEMGQWWPAWQVLQLQVIKYSDHKQLGKGKVCSLQSQITVHHGGKSKRELRAGLSCSTHHYFQSRNSFHSQEIQQQPWRMLLASQLAQRLKLSQLSYIAQGHLPREWCRPRWAGSSYIN